MQDVGFRQFLENWLLRKLLTKKQSEVKAKGYPKLLSFPHCNQWIEQAITGLYEEDLLLPLFGVVFPSRQIDFSAHAAVDVGANVGNHSCFMARYFKKVIAVEPNPTVSAVLKSNLAVNDIGNVEVHEVGLSDTTGRLPFVESSRNFGASRFQSAGQPAGVGKAKELPVTTGDALLKTCEIPVGVIKIDVEGFELKVLKGLENTLGQYKPIVLFEAHRAGGENGSLQVQGYLKDHGYAYFYTIGKKDLGYLSGVVRGFIRLLVGRDLYISQMDRIEDRFYHAIVASSYPLL